MHGLFHRALNLFVGGMALTRVFCLFVNIADAPGVIGQRLADLQKRCPIVDSYERTAFEEIAKALSDWSGARLCERTTVFQR